MKKLLELQKVVGAIKKDSTNPFFNSAYFDINKLIEVLKPELNKLGLIVLQPLVFSEGKNLVKTLVIDADGGKVLIDSFIALPDNLEPQKLGSAITYLRRYSLQSLLLLQAEDDDGAKSSPRNTPAVQARYGAKKVVPKPEEPKLDPKKDLPFNK